MPAWALFYLCTTSRLEGSTARSAARQPAACRRVLVARAHLIGSELKVTKLEEFFSILPYTPHTYIQNHWLMDQRSIFINTSSIQSKFWKFCYCWKLYILTRYLCSIKIIGEYIPRRTRIRINWNPHFQKSINTFFKKVFFQCSCILMSRRLHFYSDWLWP